ncbi:MAG: peptidylprolyl isomerase, partial [Armatimonadetes bacterium]|nr:peptidylprolyl isomerase [Armatimonadota bacterium]
MSKRRPTRKSPAVPQTGPPPLRRTIVAEKPARKPHLIKDLRRAMKGGLSVHGLREHLGHWMKYGLYLFVFAFFVGGVFSFGNAAFKHDESGREQFPKIARVFGSTLLREDRDKLLQGLPVMRNEMVTYRQREIGNLFDQWADSELLKHLAAQRHVSVSRADLNDEIEKQVNEALEAERSGMDEKAWAYKLQKEGSSATKERDNLRAKLTENLDRLSAKLLEDRVREDIEKEITITDNDLKEKYEEIGGRVILVRVTHRKPFAPMEGQKEDAEALKRRQDDEAAWRKDLDAQKAKAADIAARAKAAPAKFADLAKAVSDDYTKKDGGKLTPFTHSSARFGDEFKKAVFALKVGQVSDPIAGDEGWVIFLAETKKSWPDDFKKCDPRTMDEAKAIADGLYQRLATQHADFAALAKQYSDDPGSKDKGGEYPLAARGGWVKPFEKMAFALDVNEVSKPFRTAFGWHIMQCLERELPKAGETAPPFEEPKDAKDKAETDAVPLPSHPSLKEAKRVRMRHILIKGEDPVKKIADLRQQLEDQKKSEHYNDVLKKLREESYKDGTIKVLCPQIQAYLANKKGDRATEQFWLERAARAWPDSHPEVHYELAQLYSQRGGPFQVSAAVQQAAVTALSASDNVAEVAKDLVAALDSMY